MLLTVTEEWMERGRLGGAHAIDLHPSGGRGKVGCGHLMLVICTLVVEMGGRHSMLLIFFLWVEGGRQVALMSVQAISGRKKQGE